jgi:TetR/AcrR family transcriptional regulator, regulator of autoinduction and epiphytic fitness
LSKLAQTPREEAGLTHRQRQALWTRRMIVDAARDLFLNRGYAATTMDAIAQEAGVAVSTVYAIFKNKRSILREIRIQWHERSRAREIYKEAAEQADPERRLELVAYANRRQWEFGGTMVAIYQGAAAADREAAAELEEALRGRRAVLDRVVEGMREALQPGLDVDQAAAMLRALCRAEVYWELVDESEWSPGEYETWLADSLKVHLLPRGSSTSMVSSTSRAIPETGTLEA